MSSSQKIIARESFYHLTDIPLQGLACRGLACFAARKDAPEIWQKACTQHPAVYCLGQCYQGPSIFGEAKPVNKLCNSATAVLLDLPEHNTRHHQTTDKFEAYLQKGGGQALAKALSMPAAQIIEAIEKSGLRGRGGAGFPAGKKWQAVAKAQAQQKFLLVNADEGDPGAFSDRFLMEDNPFRLIEACVIAAIAVGAERGFIYLRYEYPQAEQTLREAIHLARENGWLGDRVAERDFRFNLTLVKGQGSYICGEETAMLNAIEGLRPEVRVRPPQPSEEGLFNAPSLVHNVETLCSIPWILLHGGDAYAAIGYGRSKGTKLISLNSTFSRPGLYEIEFGVSLRYIVEQLGQGMARGKLKGLMIGGPLAGIIPPELLDVPFDYEALAAIGASVGHGGIIAFRNDTKISEILAEVFRFGCEESCGKCTPCHFGSAELAHMCKEAAMGTGFKHSRWSALITALEKTSLCGHGRGLAEFARSIERYYAEELAECFI